MKLPAKLCLKGKYDLEEKKTCRWLEVFCAFSAALSFFCIGAAHSYTSPAITSLGHDLVFNPTPTRNDFGWVATSPPFVALAGSILSAPLLQYLGRQKTLVLQVFPCIIGWLFIGFATSLPMVLIGRGLTGLSTGLAASAAHLYVSEFARDRIRGMLGFLPGMMLSLGILSGFIAGTQLNWRFAAFVLSIVPAVSLVFIMALPESPTWLLMKGRESEAFESLSKIRGAGRNKQVREEIEDIKQHLEETKEAFEKLPLLGVIKRRDVWWPLCVALSLMMFQQFCGANAVIFYLENILVEAQEKSGGVKVLMTPGEGAILVGVVQFLAFFISLPLIDWLGRKASLLTSSFFMIVSHISLGFYFYSCARGNDLVCTFTAPWLPITFLCSFIASYSIGFASVPYIIASEVFPSHLRSCLCSLASFVNLICLCITVRYFLVVKEYLYDGYIFFLFAIVCGVSCIVIVLAVPETKGKSLAQVQELFQGYSNFNSDSFESSFDEHNSSSQERRNRIVARVDCPYHACERANSF